MQLKQALKRKGFAFLSNFEQLLGCPDVVFPKEKVIVFCDGDFWHGRNAVTRFRRLAKGHNSSYWRKKLRSNIERDRRVDKALRRAGWSVLRLWETDILNAPDDAAEQVLKRVRTRGRLRTMRRA